MKNLPTFESFLFESQAGINRNWLENLAGKIGKALGADVNGNPEDPAAENNSGLLLYFAANCYNLQIDCTTLKMDPAKVDSIVDPIIKSYRAEAGVKCSGFRPNQGIRTVSVKAS